MLIQGQKLLFSQMILIKNLKKAPHVFGPRNKTLNVNKSVFSKTLFRNLL